VEVYISLDTLKALVNDQWITKDSIEVNGETLATIVGKHRNQIDRLRVKGFFGNNVRKSEDKRVYLYKLGNCFRLLNGIPVGDGRKSNLMKTMEV
jgi:hypothetical protein